jgi:hypothetical protein
MRFVAEFPEHENETLHVKPPLNVHVVVFDVVFVIVRDRTVPLIEVTAPDAVSMTASSDAPGAVVFAAPPEDSDHVASVAHAPPAARANFWVIRTPRRRGRRSRFRRP